jgi:hypothetical protein
MGYFFPKGKGFQALCSDNAAELSEEICEAIVGKLRIAEKKKDNEYNTEGIVNVALFLQELETPRDCNHAIHAFLTEFVVRFKKSIAKEQKGKWDDKENKQDHINRLKDVLANLEKKLKTMK